MGAVEIALDSIYELLRREGKSNLETEEFPWNKIKLNDFLLSSIYIIAPDPNDLEAQMLSGTYKIAWQDLYEWMSHGFYKCAADGYNFVSESRIKEKFGKSLQENYPGAGEAFMSLARTFWTLKLVEIDLRHNHDLIIFSLISQLNRSIGNIFFPNRPNPKVEIAPGVVDDRESVQRNLILSSGANIDIDEFLSGSPIIRDSRLAKNSGCLGILLTIAILIIMVVWVLF
jgi:hypothetical protein